MNSLQTRKKQLCVCLVSDFFYPKAGGVEVHLYYLSVCLIRRNCKVIVITHHYDDRQGVKYMGNGVKVKLFQIFCFLGLLYAKFDFT